MKTERDGVREKRREREKKGEVQREKEVLPLCSSDSR